MKKVKPPTAPLGLDENSGVYNPNHTIIKEVKFEVRMSPNWFPIVFNIWNLFVDAKKIERNLVNLFGT